MVLPAEREKNMKKVLAILLALLTLLPYMGVAVAAAGETPLTMSLTQPDEFKNATAVEFESCTNMADKWVRDGTQTNAGTGYVYNYIFLKKDTENPSAKIEFTVAEDGKYDFCVELMAFESTLPRTSLLQIDDGEKYYLRSEHGTRHLITEYFVGMSAELKAGKHTMTIYLADDFDDKNVKSLYFDKFSFVKQADEPTDTGEAETTVTETNPADETNETVTDNASEKVTENASEKVTEKADDTTKKADSTTAEPKTEGEDGSLTTALIIAVAAAVVVAAVVVVVIIKKKKA